jgi:uncharacterized protein
MKLSRILILVIAAILVTVIYSVTSGPDEVDYINSILKERKEKDDFLRNSDSSPFGAARSTFTGLKYFDPNPAYRVVAKLQPVESKQVLVISTSSGESNRYLPYAWAEFEINDIPCRLLILEVMDSGPSRGTLFLAFADQTSAKETYGAGRYLELKKIGGASSVTLDFNRAYNPYCAYAENFSCPFPPPENILHAPIEAGEKSYHQED